ncbi:hypothetical protein [Vibrio diazotrophicus]|uniref:hypothetical protein n=1 Tax=Vibrio diazotrophicus TaxID=685 RepID=UPI00142DA46B|nr:hypothetical protein [Vibrio diazotrophicus]NIY90659.1 hypothetical protein [Vibrio diazotrophicus]
MQKIISALIISILLSACGGEESDTPDTNISIPTSPFATEVVDSMTKANEAILLNASAEASWSKSGHITQGLPRGDAAPAWWADSVLDDRMKTSASWSALTGWFTIFESNTNTDQHVKIYYSDFEIWLLKGSDVKHAFWEKLAVTPTTWASYYDSDIVTWQGSALPDDSSGYYEFQHPDILHGGTSKVAFDGDDVLGVFVRTQAWLDRVDEDAELLMSIGVDYYPTVDSSVSKGDFANANYLPGAGTSRFVYLTTEPKWFTMANVADDALVNVDKSSPFFINGGKTYLTIEEWMNNHPPLDQ